MESSTLSQISALVNTTVLVNNTAENFTTEESNTQSVRIEQLYRVSEIINGLIIILGYITNTLILVILGRKRIGSQTTRIILIFLALNDIAVMTLETFVHFIPYYTEWFRVFYTDLACGIGFTMQASAITTSSWYIVIMTLERFTVVWFPMKAKIICTQKKILIACLCTPVLCFAIFSYFITDFILTPPSDGYVFCESVPSYSETEDSRMGFKSRINAWTVLYFHVPAVTIVTLNTAIAFKLKRASTAQKKLTRKPDKDPHSRGSKYRTTLSRSHSGSKNKNGIKKATQLVVVASVAFLVMMIPRGISSTIAMDADWGYQTEELEIVDTVTYLLQYLNHASNFFVYVLANNSFRRELLVILTVCCKGRRPRPSSAHGSSIHTTYVKGQSTKLNRESSNQIQTPLINSPVST